jgi:hypothetical protein
LPTSLSNSEPIPEFVIARVIVEALRLSRNRPAISLNEIAEKAGTTTFFVGKVLENSIQANDVKTALLDSSTRFNLAIEAVKVGAILEVARALTWQEFETFADECLVATGFSTQKGVVVKGDARRWQIDVIATKGSILLAMDCKHWESPGYASKLSKAGEHQRLAVQALIKSSTVTDEFRERVLALPIILTLFEPRSRLAGGAVAVSVEQFADFLEGLSPYSSELPFVSILDTAKSSISQHIGTQTGFR